MSTLDTFPIAVKVPTLNPDKYAKVSVESAHFLSPVGAYDDIEALRGRLYFF